MKRMIIYALIALAASAQAQMTTIHNITNTYNVAVVPVITNTVSYSVSNITLYITNFVSVYGTAFEADMQGRLMPRATTNWLDQFWRLDENGDLSPQPTL